MQTSKSSTHRCISHVFLLKKICFAIAFIFGYSASNADTIAREEFELLKRGFIFFPPRSVEDVQRELDISSRKAAEIARLKLEQERKAQEELAQQQALIAARREAEKELAKQAAEIARLKQEQERKALEELAQQQVQITSKREAEKELAKQAAEIARLKLEQERKAQEELAQQQALIAARREAEKELAKQAAEIARLKQEQERKALEELARQQELIAAKREAEEELARQAAEIARLKQERMAQEKLAQQQTHISAKKDNDQEFSRKSSQYSQQNTSFLPVDKDYETLRSRIFQPIAGQINGAYGTNFLIGYSRSVNEKIKMNADIAYLPSGVRYHLINSNIYEAERKYYRFGVGIEIQPLSDENLYVSGGLSFNKIESSYKLRGNQSATINGKTVASDNGDLNISTRFPSVTPYVSVGYTLVNKSEPGWSGGVRLGLLYGKRKTKAESRQLGLNGITIDDIKSEVNIVNDALGKNNFIPELTLGFSYAY